MSGQISTLIISTVLMGPKGRYTIIEQSNTLLKESLHILCPAWAPHTLLAALISIALLSSLILSLSSLASLLTSLTIILPHVMCANDECFVHRICGISFTFCTQRDARTYTKLEWLFYRIFWFTFRAQRDGCTHTKLEWLFYRIFLFTLCTQRDGRTYTKLEWLFYRIFLSTLRAQCDACTYTKT